MYYFLSIKSNFNIIAPMDEEYLYYIKLCAIPEIGAMTAMRLIRHFGSPREALSASRGELMEVEKIGA